MNIDMHDGLYGFAWMMRMIICTCKGVFFVNFGLWS